MGASVPFHVYPPAGARRDARPRGRASLL